MIQNSKTGLTDIYLKIYFRILSLGLGLGTSFGLMVLLSFYNLVRIFLVHCVRKKMEPLCNQL